MEIRRCYMRCASCAYICGRWYRELKCNVEFTSIYRGGNIIISYKTQKNIDFNREHCKILIILQKSMKQIFTQTFSCCISVQSLASIWTSMDNVNFEHEHGRTWTARKLSMQSSGQRLKLSFFYHFWQNLIILDFDFEIFQMTRIPDSRQRSYRFTCEIF